MDPLDELAFRFLESPLLKGEVLELRIPKVVEDEVVAQEDNGAQEQYLDFQEHYDLSDTNDYQQGRYVSRKLVTESSMSKYVQLMAVAALVKRLRTGIHYFYSL